MKITITQVPTNEQLLKYYQERDALKAKFQHEMACIHCDIAKLEQIINQARREVKS